MVCIRARSDPWNPIIWSMVLFVSLRPAPYTACSASPPQLCTLFMEGGAGLACTLCRAGFSGYASHSMRAWAWARAHATHGTYTGPALHVGSGAGLNWAHRLVLQLLWLIWHGYSIQSTPWTNLTHFMHYRAGAKACCMQYMGLELVRMHYSICGMQSWFVACAECGTCSRLALLSGSGAQGWSVGSVQPARPSEFDTSDL